MTDAVHIAVKAKYAPHILLAASVLLASTWYLIPNPLEFPMDDTYIHFVYAQNLADTGRLFFNSIGESGVGSTSILWVFLLSAGYRLGIPLHLTAKILGSAGLFLSGLTLFRLLEKPAGRGTALGAALLVVLSGHMLWFSLSGMETILFLTLGLIALRLYLQAQWAWLGIVLGLQILTRPEGVVLAIVLAAVEVARNRRIHRGILLTGALTLAMSVPWFAYLLVRTGELLPTSAVGKQLSMALSLKYALSQYDAIAFLNRFPALTFIGMWLVYPLEFVLGGASLPGPNISIQTSIGNVEYQVSIWAILGWLTALVPITWIGLKRLFKKRTWDWGPGRPPNPILLLLLWSLCHNLVYMIVLPSPGTASRYGALNHLLLWTVLIVIISRYVTHSRYRLYLAAWLLLIAGSNTIYWNDVYDANLDHMLNVRIRAADYLKENASGEGLCGVSDIGAIRFFSDMPVFDLGGLVDPDLGNIYLAGRLPQHIADHEVRCLVMPGRAGTNSDGYLDFAEIMGFTDTPFFEMEEIEVFEIDRERWLTGYLPTMNYQATVTVYRLTDLR